MHLFWMLLFTAHADEEPPPEVSASWQDTDIWRRGEREPIPGIVGIEAALEKRHANLSDLTRTAAEYSFSVQAPSRAYEQGRAAAWQAAFGADRLTVRHQNVADGTLLAEAETTIGTDSPLWDPNRIDMCTTLRISESRSIDLVTWDENSGVRPTAETSAALYQTSLFFLNNTESRSLLAYLNPGDSVTVVEILEDQNPRPQRKIEVKRRDAHVTLKERRHAQEICVELQSAVSD